MGLKNKFNFFENRVKSKTKLFFAFKKYKALFITGFATLGTGIGVVSIGTGAITNDVVIDNISYGEELSIKEDAKTFIGQVDYYEYSTNGKVWTKEMPSKAGEYKVRVVTKNVFGNERRSKASTFKIAKYETQLILNNSDAALNLDYGADPSSYYIDLLDEDYVSHIEYNYFTLGGVDYVCADADTLVIKDSSGNDVTSCYDVKCIQSKANINSKNLVVQCKDIELNYTGNVLSFAHSYTDSTLANIVGKDSLGISYDIYDQSNNLVTSLVEVGNYTLKIKTTNITNSNHYNIATLDSNVVVKGPSLKIIVPSSTFDYDGESHSNTSNVTAIGLKPNHHLVLDSTPKTITNYQDSIENTLIYKVFDNNDNDVTDNYDITYQYGTLSFNPLDLYISVNDTDITFGDEAPTSYSYTIDLSTLASSTSLADLVITGTPIYHTNYIKGNDVGSYEISMEGISVKYYNVIFNTGNLNVNKKTIEYTWSIPTSSGTYTYTGNELSKPVASFVDIITNTTKYLSVSLSGDDEFINANTTYTFIADLTSTNYNLINNVTKTNKNSIDVEVGKAYITIPTLNTTSIVYDGNNHDVVFNLSSYYELTNTSDSLSIKDVGTYHYEFSLTDSYNTLWSDSSSENISYDVVISKANVSLVWENTNFTYGDTLTKPIAYYYSLGINPIKVYIDEDDIVTTDSINGVGTYSYSVNNFSSDSYTIGSNLSTTYTINPKELVIDITKDVNVTYGNNLNSNVDETYFTVNGLVNNDVVSDLYVSLTISSSNYICANNVYSNVNGNYTYTINGFDNANYTYTINKGTIKVNKADLAVSWDINDSYTYNFTNQFDSLNASINGLTSDVQISLKDYIKIKNSSSLIFKDAKEYEFYIDLELDNYNLVNNSKSSTITVLTLDESEIINVNTNYTYTGESLKLTYSQDFTNMYGTNELTYITSSLVSNNFLYNISSLSNVIDVNSYKITFTLNDSNCIFTNSTDKYEVDITISKATLNFVQNDISFTYGDSINTYYLTYGVDYELDGFVGKDISSIPTVTGILSATPTSYTPYISTPNTYSLEFVTKNINVNNYNINYPESVTFTLNKKEIQLDWSDATNATLVYGNTSLDSVRPFIEDNNTKTYIDIASFTGAASFKDAGEYILEAISSNDNYIFTNTVSPTITIDPYLLDLTITNKNITYGDEIDYVISDVVVGSIILPYDEDIDDIGLIVTTTYTLTSVCDNYYVLSVDFDNASKNYLVSVTNGSLYVAKKEYALDLGISNNQEIEYDGNSHLIVPIYDTNKKLTDASINYTYSVDDITYSSVNGYRDAGYYKAEVSVSSSYYKFTNLSVNFRVTKADLVINLSNIIDDYNPNDSTYLHNFNILTYSNYLSIVSGIKGNDIPLTIFSSGGSVYATDAVNAKKYNLAITQDNTNYNYVVNNTPTISLDALKLYIKWDVRNDLVFTNEEIDYKPTAKYSFNNMEWNDVPANKIKLNTGSSIYNAGTYYFECTLEFDNYAFENNDNIVAVTVHPFDITISANNITTVYNQGFDYDESVNGFEVDKLPSNMTKADLVDYITYSTNYRDGIDNASSEGYDLFVYFSNPNFNATLVNGKVIVDKDDVTINWSGSQTLTYNYNSRFNDITASLPSLGFPSDQYVDINNYIKVKTGDANFTKVGEYVLYVDYEFTNYNITNNSYAVSIDYLYISEPTIKDSYEYSGNEVEVIYGISKENAYYKQTINTNVFTAGQEKAKYTVTKDYSNAIYVNDVANKYAVKFTLTDPNTLWSDSLGIYCYKYFDITKKELTITYNNSQYDIAYGEGIIDQEEVTTYVLSGFVSIDDITNINLSGKVYIKKITNNDIKSYNVGDGYEDVYALVSTLTSDNYSFVCSPLYTNVSKVDKTVIIKETNSAQVLESTYVYGTYYGYNAYISDTLEEVTLVFSKDNNVVNEVRNVGTYTFSFDESVYPNYNLVYSSSKQLSITKYSIDLELDDAEITYDYTGTTLNNILNDSLIKNISTLKYDDTISDLGLTYITNYSLDKKCKDGYELDVTYTNSNYDINITKGTLDVNKYAINSSIDLSAYNSIIYNGYEQTLNLEINTPYHGWISLDYTVTVNDEIAVFKNAGTYHISVANDFYSVINEEFDLTISKKDLTIEANNILVAFGTLSSVLNFDASNVNTYLTVTGLVGSDTIQNLLTANTFMSFEYTPYPSNDYTIPGTYEDYISLGNFDNTNYNITYVKGDLIVQKYVINSLIWEYEDSYTYTGTAFDLPSVYFMDYLGTKTPISSSYIQISSINGSTFKNAGTYRFSLTTIDDPLYTFACEGIDIVVNKQKVDKPTIDANEFDFNGYIQAPTITTDSRYTSTFNTATSIRVGDYSITTVLNDKDNYEWSSGDTNDVSNYYSINPIYLEVELDTITQDYDGLYHIHYYGYDGGNNAFVFNVADSTIDALIEINSEAILTFDYKYIPTYKILNAGDYVLYAYNFNTSPIFSITIGGIDYTECFIYQDTLNINITISKLDIHVLIGETGENTFVYDGSSHSNTNYAIDTRYDNFIDTDILICTYTYITNVGSCTNDITFTLKNADDTNVTKSYNITVDYASTLTVTPLEVNVCWYNLNATYSSNVSYYGNYYFTDVITGASLSSSTNEYLTYEASDLSITTKMKNADTYRVILDKSKYPNYIINYDDTHTYTVNKYKVALPNTEDYDTTYTSYNIYCPVTSNPSYYTNSTNYFKDPNTYTITYTLKDKDNTCWEDESTNDLTKKFIINKHSVGAIVSDETIEYGTNLDIITPTYTNKLQGINPSLVYEVTPIIYDLYHEVVDTSSPLPKGTYLIGFDPTTVINSKYFVLDEDDIVLGTLSVVDKKVDVIWSNYFVSRTYDKSITFSDDIYPYYMSNDQMVKLGMIIYRDNVLTDKIEDAGVYHIYAVTLNDEQVTLVNDEITFTISKLHVHGYNTDSLSVGNDETKEFTIADYYSKLGFWAYYGLLSVALTPSDIIHPEDINFATDYVKGANPGTYTVTATLPSSNTNYIFDSTVIAITIYVEYQQASALTAKYDNNSTSYTGSEISFYDVGNGYSVEYYSDSSCLNKLASNPYRSGSYYVKITPNDGYQVSVTTKGNSNITTTYKYPAYCVQQVTITKPNAITITMNAKSCYFNFGLIGYEASDLTLSSGLKGSDYIVCDFNTDYVGLDVSDGNPVIVTSGSASVIKNTLKVYNGDGIDVTDCYKEFKWASGTGTATLTLKAGSFAIETDSYEFDLDTTDSSDYSYSYFSFVDAYDSKHKARTNALYSTKHFVNPQFASGSSYTYTTTSSTSIKINSVNSGVDNVIKGIKYYYNGQLIDTTYYSFYTYAKGKLVVVDPS